MTCPECRSSDTGVSHTLHKRHGTEETITRYRRCKSCAHRWKTREESVCTVVVRVSKGYRVKD